ncbi:hypothetical protein E2C01_022863 [Portunus trituberculatus]|uniref:Uncharacterized protein n=1 Tax=Portunus trituberculatus TaxID=210409 RepID=A0A5B7E6K1_PORTR|nr:hypothetical protein [Portunus trituberculatus]
MSGEERCSSRLTADLPPTARVGNKTEEDDEIVRNIINFLTAKSHIAVFMKCKSGGTSILNSRETTRASRTAAAHSATRHMPTRPMFCCSCSHAFALPALPDLAVSCHLFSRSPSRPATHVLAPSFPASVTLNKSL